MSYATYTTMVAEVERRLCDEVERLRAAVQGRGVAAGQICICAQVWEETLSASDKQQSRHAVCSGGLLKLP